MSALSHLRAFRSLAARPLVSASPLVHRPAQTLRCFGSVSVVSKSATSVSSSSVASTLRPLGARTPVGVYPQPLRLSAFHSSAIARADASPSDIQVDHQKYSPKQLRNIAIIAHVDHGKTTLVDCLLKQAGTRLSADSGERVMDSNALEKERGITILSKCTSVLWNSEVPADGHNGLYRVNIVDTPGHADFGGEVERIMSMVDGVLLVIDATDGPMTQTKFVLRKALAQNLKPVVVINKVDRGTARVGGEVENEVFDLFVSLDATDEQLDYKTVYCSAREGWAVTDLSHPRTSMAPLFDTVLKHVPHPTVDTDSPFSMLVTQIDSNQFLGKLLLGRVKTGTVTVGDTLHALDPAADVLEQVRVTKILTRRGVEQIAVDSAASGDIISLAGFTTATVNCTLADPSVNKVIPSTPIDPPTLSMTFSVNDSPLSGKEGKMVTSSALRTRLLKEAETNVSLKVIESDNKESFAVQGRGELQLGILLEEMRREGYEVSVSPPRVVYRRKDGTFVEEKDGMPLSSEERRNVEEPLEEVTIEVPQGFSGTIIEKMNGRKGEMANMTTLSDGRCRMVFVIPTRGLIGYRTEFQHDTAGQGTINNIFHSYTPYMGMIDKTQKGALISIADGVCTAFALDNIQSRGILFVEPGTVTYNGMVIGENARDNDLEVNPVKTKELTNVRSTSKEEKIRLTPPKIMTIEESIAYMRDDEVIEITPKNIRLRKKLLDSTARKSASRRK